MRRTAARYLIAAATAGLMATGCRVQTTVEVTATPSGHGTVEVMVNLDPAAVDALGGRSALAGELEDQDLKAAGWSVTGPLPGSAGNTEITVSHPFSTWAQATALTEEVAGSGSARPFRMTLSGHHSFWRSWTSLSGTVDLRCGLNCFGDAGLRSLTGSSVGVDPAALERSSGQEPGQVFAFSVLARLPGSVTSADTAGRSGGALEWSPQLGSAIELRAETASWNWAHIIGVIVAGAVVLLAGVAALGWRVRSRRRRGRGGDADGGRDAGSAGAPAG